MTALAALLLVPAQSPAAAPAVAAAPTRLPEGPGARCICDPEHELGRSDEAVAESRVSQAGDPSETASANEIAYLQSRKAGRGPSGERTTSTDQVRKPQG